MRDANADDRGVHRSDEGEANKLAQKRLQASRGDASVAAFYTNVIDLAPGGVMRVLDHPQRELGDGKKQLVVQSRINGRVNSQMSHYVEVRGADQPYSPPLRQQKPKVLGVENVIVCGHTHCGAIKALLDPRTRDRLPLVRRWLAQAGRLRSIVAERYAHLDEDARMLAAVGENVLVQLENLRAFPNVAERLERGALTIGGWVYDIATGDVFEYDPTAGQFGPIGQPSIPPPAPGPVLPRP